MIINQKTIITIIKNWSSASRTRAPKDMYYYGKNKTGTVLFFPEKKGTVFFDILLINQNTARHKNKSKSVLERPFVIL